MLYKYGSEELYDTINDPNEWFNIANEEGSEKIKAIFQKAIPEKKKELSIKSYYSVNEYWRTKAKELLES